MAIRSTVEQFAATGPFPASEDAEVDDINRRFELLERIARPVTPDEALVLSRSFGPDDAFGLAWTLLHLIETASEPLLREPPSASANEWIPLIWERSLR